MFCKARGIVIPVEIVDDIRPHHGDERLFFDRAKLQSLCKSCHDGLKQSNEKRGRDWLPDVNPVTGWPRDPMHPANRPRAWQPKARQP